MTKAAESFRDTAGSIRPGWRVVLASIFGLALGPSVILMMCFGVFAPALAAEFGWGIGAISLGATIISLVLAALSPVQGRLVDRYGSRRVILVSMPLFGLGILALSQLSGDIRVYYGACGLVALLALGVWPTSYMTIVSTWFDRHLGLALGSANVGPGLGGALVPVLIGAVMTAYDWRTAYLVLGLLVLVVVLPAAFIWLRENPRASTPRALGAGPAGMPLREVYRDRSFWMLAAAFTALGVLSSGILIHQVNILIDHGMTRGAAIGLQSVLGAASIVGRLFAGWLLDRLHVARLMLAMLLAGAGACLLYASPTTGPVLVLGAVTFGFIIGTEFDALGFAIRRYHGLAAFGSVFGLIFGMFSVGGAIGAALMGILRDATGAYTAGLYILAAMSVFSGVVLARLGPYRFRNSDAPAAEPIIAAGSAAA